MSYSFATPDQENSSAGNGTQDPYSFAKPDIPTTSVSDDNQGPNTMPGGIVFANPVSRKKAENELQKHPEIYKPSPQADAALMQQIGPGPQDVNDKAASATQGVEDFVKSLPKEMHPTWMPESIGNAIAPEGVNPLTYAADLAQATGEAGKALYVAGRDVLAVPLAVGEAAMRTGLQSLPNQMQGIPQALFGDEPGAIPSPVENFVNAYSKRAEGIRSVGDSPLNFIGGPEMAGLKGVASDALIGAAKAAAEDAVQNGDVSASDLVNGTTGTLKSAAEGAALSGLLSGTGRLVQSSAINLFPGEAGARRRLINGNTSDQLTPQFKESIYQKFSPMQPIIKDVGPRLRDIRLQSPFAPGFKALPSQMDYWEKQKQMMEPLSEDFEQAMKTASQNYEQRLSTPEEITLTPNDIKKEMQARLESAIISKGKKPDIPSSDIENYGDVARDYARSSQLPAARVLATMEPYLSIPGVPARMRVDPNEFANAVAARARENVPSENEILQRWPIERFEGAPVTSAQEISGKIPLHPSEMTGIKASLNKQIFTPTLSDRALAARTEASQAHQILDDFLDKLGYSEALAPDTRRKYGEGKAFLNRLQRTPQKGQMMRVGPVQAQLYGWNDEVSNYSKPVNLYRIGKLLEGIGKRQALPSRKSAVSGAE